MDSNIDYYNILGVITSAENAVIKAAYRALAKIYHPDKNNHGNEKIKEINTAYEVLSDPIKRAEYDKSREETKHNANSTSFESNAPFSNDSLEKDWKLAVDFFPTLESLYGHLAKISWRLAFAFKLNIIENKKYGKSESIAKKLKHEYLVKYFGKNKEVLKYAEYLILNKMIDEALYLNTIVNVMGNSVPFDQIKQKVENKFPEINKTKYKIFPTNKHKLYSLIENDNGLSFKHAEKYAKLMGASVYTPFLGYIVLEQDGKKYEFNNRNEFCCFILDKYANSHG
jgi:curved DNA-binding protein CbpA